MAENTSPFVSFVKSRTTIISFSYFLLFFVVIFESDPLGKTFPVTLLDKLQLLEPLHRSLLDTRRRSNMEVSSNGERVRNNQGRVYYVI